MAVATFGAGCFWSVQDFFQKIPGVTKTEAGFMGGETKKPSYKQVCKGKTGHIEVVHIHYDEKKISYERLLDAFWMTHDPTQVARQGPDIGEQYSSVIFYHDKAQLVAAEHSKEKLEEMKRYDKPIATKIVPAKDFWKAEEEHQHYLQKHQ